MTIRVLGYEFEAITVGEDANWVNAEVDVRMDIGGAYRARIGLTMLTEELEQFRDELRELEGKRTGEAEFVHIEEEMGLTVRFQGDKGALNGFVLDHLGPELRFGDIDIDRSFVREALAELSVVVDAYPVRWKAFG